MHSTNYRDTFIAVAPDSGAAAGTVPPERAEVAFRTFRLIHEQPYRLTSDEVLFTVFADRKRIAPKARAAAREAFFARPQACLRASPLGKTYGWGIHSDADGKVALYGVETEAYRALSAGRFKGKPVLVKTAMRTSRARKR